MQEQIFLWLNDKLVSQWQLLLLYFLIALVASFVAILSIVYFLSHEHFLTSNRQTLVWKDELRSRPVLLVCHLIKNLLGLSLLLVGVVLLFMPGQGLITILLSVLLIDFPNKHFLVGRIIAKPNIRSGLNKMRLFMRRRPFEFDD